MGIAQKLRTVLILVLVDNGLGRDVEALWSLDIAVLILVLVDNGLGLDGSKPVPTLLLRVLILVLVDNGLGPPLVLVVGLLPRMS